MKQGGSIILSDTKDVWGNDLVLGLGEHAVRTQAPPMFYEKTGDILRWVDFESPTPNYKLGSYSASYVRRTADICLTGNFSLKMYSTHPTHEASITVYNSDFKVGKVGLQFTFASSSTNGQFIFGFIRYTQTESWHAKVMYYMPTSTLSVYTPLGYVSIGTYDFLTDFWLGINKNS